jgi:1-aminocyclopropane-1-carboxylate deaminase/D-cysteine desulfhydrase-like pyridoxal-dependent ACC family enzyme
MTRILIIGGTGMLQPAIAHCVEQDYDVTLVARDRKNLTTIAAAYPEHKIHIIAQDYHANAPFIAALQEAIKEQGAFDQVICWMHSSGKESLIALLQLLAQHNQQTIFYHVKGSASYNPENVQQLDKNLTDALDYREVILGFKIERGFSRWLTNAEISAGTIDAFATGRKRTVIGVTEPWAARP